MGWFLIRKKKQNENGKLTTKNQTSVSEREKEKKTKETKKAIV